MSELALKLIADNKVKHTRGEDARVLDLGNCGLDIVPEEICSCEWIETLILSDEYQVCNIESLTWKIKKSINKGKINSISSFPKNFFRLQKLKNLFFEGYYRKFKNTYDDLMESWGGVSDLSIVAELSNLQQLGFIKTTISDLTPISQLTNLQSFYCFFNRNLNNFLPISGLSNLQALDFHGVDTLEGCEFSDLSSLDMLPNLRILNCSSNNISDLRPISKSKNIEVLDCSKNKISDLSPLINLHKLKVLNCSSNNIGDLQPISKLKGIEVLNCSNTEISDLSPLINLNKLKVIKCSNTNISDLAPIIKLSKLQRITCFYTKIKHLKPLFPLILSGKEIDFIWSYDGIDYNYAIINNKESDVLTINIDGCPLDCPPLEIIKKGNEAIINYIVEFDKQQSLNSEVKLIIVGNSTVGKTSIINFLLHRKFYLGQTTTHGISQNCWVLNGVDLRRDTEIHIWDFGGQEYFHATHRLFLSRNAVYVLVWDMQTNKGGFCDTVVCFDNDPEPNILPLEHFPQAWWLKNIQYLTRGYNPPVLLVQNKCARDGQQRVSNEFEQPPFGLLPEWLDNHIDLEATSNSQHPKHKKWLRQFETFEERLLEILQNQLAHYEFAVYHRDIRDKIRILAAEGVTDMPYSEFEKLCHEIEANAKMDLVQIYLRDITGDILYYPNNERLKQRVFLRPGWVCDSIYQILSRQVQKHEGLFGLDWVREALRCDEANALDFVALMREFELIFEYPKESMDEVQQWVAPQYLPETCTEQGELTATKKRMKLMHGFTIWFPDFLPKSHIARFVAIWGSQAKDRLFWKNGLLFETKDCTVLVERVTDDKIRIEVQPHHPKQAEVISDIFQSFLKLEDGQAGFAVSLDAEHFVWWRDIQERMKERAQQIKTITSEPGEYIDLRPFSVFQKLIISAKKVFISYSKSDKSYLIELKRHLASLKRQDLLQTWDDTDLKPGEEWDTAIRRELNSADIVILLVSSDLIATDYIWDMEMKAAMERHQNGEATVIPVIVRPSNWEDAPFGILNALPEKGKPISKWEDQDEGWAQVVARIKQVLK